MHFGEAEEKERGTKWNRTEQKKELSGNCGDKKSARARFAR